MNFPILRVVCLLVSLVVCAVGPGLFFVRHLRWKPLETLCTSVAASLVFVYLVSLAIYVANLPTAAAHWVLSGICWGMSALCWRDIARLLGRRHVRRVLGSFGILWVWIFLQAADMRHFAGGTWYGDWIEHYKRCLFFLDHWDLQYRFLGMYLVTARPPLMNLVCAHFMANFGQEFIIYQLAAGFLNLLPVLVCFLIATAGVHRGWGRRGTTAALLFLLAANASFTENVAFPWTKSLTATFCLLSAWLYLRGWLKEDRKRITIAFALAAAGCLAHFYAMVWAAGLALHYLVVAWPRRREKYRELFGIGVVCAGLILSWLLWAVWAFGWKVPFNSSTTAWAVQAQTPLERVQTFGFNGICTLTPYFFRIVPYEQLAQTDPAGRARDLIFCLYQTNALFAWGICGGLILLFALPRNHWPDKVRRFWWIFLVFSSVMGNASVATPDVWGAMHLWGMPLMFLGLCALAAALGEMATAWRWVALAGCTIDFLGGILLQIRLEHRVYTFRSIAGATLPVVVGGSLPNHFAQENLVAKEVLGYRFLGDYFPAASGRIELLMCAIFIVLAARMVLAVNAGVREAANEKVLF